MVNIFETTIVCRFCNGVKRITHLQKEPTVEDYEGWLVVKGSNNRNRYVCNDCIEMISAVVSDGLKSQKTETRSDKKVKKDD